MTDIPVSLPKSPSADAYAEETERALIPATSDPYQLLGEWLAAAEAHETNDSSAMSLATVDADGMPDVRIVLLRGLSPVSGFEFYTNYASAKGQQMDLNPKAALCFHWKSLRRQIRVRGGVERLSEADSDAYFRSRAPQSRIAAIASDQSQILSDRSIFDRRVAEISTIYGDDDDIPRPPHWGGYRLQPVEIEFWQDQHFRMHDRLKFTRTSTGWAQCRLYP